MTDPGSSTYGLLTEEGLARSRQRIGVPQPSHNPPHNYEVTWDGVRHFAFGYGDDNPLYCNPEYAKQTRWGQLIAPPTFMYTMGEQEPGFSITPEQKALLKGDPFAGLGSYQAVMNFEWWRPLFIGDRLLERRAQVGVKAKRSEFGGRTAHVTNAMVFFKPSGDLHAIQRGTWINAERHTSAKRQKEKETAEPYTPEQLKEIDAYYEAERRRGGEPRYWEDVNVGDEVQPKVKGPLTNTDVVVWHLGWGMQLTPPGAFRLQYLIRKKAPGLYPPNPLNVPDTVQRLHWEPQRAKELGIPTSYDYGGMRETWLCHLATDWMGDAGWLWKMSCQHRRFNFQGDTTWVRGKVTDKRRHGDRHEVDLEIWCENQRGIVTSPGNATVLLPTRDQAVVLPNPPADNVDALFQHEIDELAKETSDQ